MSDPTPSKKLIERLEALSENNTKPATQEQIAAIWAHFITVQDALAGLLVVGGNIGDQKRLEESREALYGTVNSLGENLQKIFAALKDEGRNE